MNRKVIAAATGVLLLGAGAAGLAQAQDRDQRGRGGGGGGGAAREAPRAAPQRAAPRVERSQPRAERSQPRAERRAVQRPQRERAQQVQRQRERNVDRAESRQRVQKQQAERSQREQKQQVERRQRDQQQRAEREQRDQKQAAERQQREQRQAAERRQREGGPQGKEARSPERAGPQQVNRIQASDEQRKGVRDRIFRERSVDRIKGRDFRAKVIVGTHIEQRHRRHLHRLTPAILAFAPIYAGYSYLVVDDEICIVDPATYYVVDVIPSSAEYAAGPSRPQLVLSAEEMGFIYASVPKDRPVDVRVRLALGAEVPGRVDLELFPGGVIDRVPQVESYRYIVVADDVVIVDPRDRSVALVITE